MTHRSTLQGLLLVTSLAWAITGVHRVAIGSPDSPTAIDEPLVDESSTVADNLNAPDHPDARGAWLRRVLARFASRSRIGDRRRRERERTREQVLQRARSHRCGTPPHPGGHWSYRASHDGPAAASDAR